VCKGVLYTSCMIVVKKTTVEAKNTILLQDRLCDHK
jgi:hypothetical protein